MSSLSNMTERIIRGHVTDYIKIKYDKYSTNVFNIADSNIIVCFICLFYQCVYA